MTSIDGLFAILEDRGLMPAVALFSLSAVLGLLYLSSGNLKAPTPPTSDRTWMPGSMRSDMARLPMPGMWIRRKRTQSGRKVKNMNLEDSIVSTISDAKPMMILALCTIVLFVIVASLIEAWLAKARKAKSEADTLPSGPEASQRSVEKSEAVEQAVDNAGGFDLDERRKARAPKSIPDRRPWFFKTVMGRGLVCLLTKVIPILLPVVWFSLVVMGMLPNPLALFFFSPDPQRMNVVSPSDGWFWLLLTMFIVAVLHDSLPALLRRLGWMMDKPKTASASLTSMVESHYGVSNLEVDWFGTAAGGVPPFDGLYSCRYDTGRRKNNGVLRVRNHRVWLYGPDGCEEERHGH